jgi:UDP-N-acetylglucosamine 1-carboxyvinyltransferase
MNTSYLHVERSVPLQGKAELIGAKNAVLVIMASLLLTNGKSRLNNVPYSADVLQMIMLLRQLGAEISFFAQEHVLEIDTTQVNKWQVSPEIMKKMRASILVMGPLLARFGCADTVRPGGCVLGARSIDYHVKNFVKMGVDIQENGESLYARVSQLKAAKLVLEYPSVGATENLMMAAVLTPGTTRVVNAALEPEVFDLIAVLKKMGARITILPPATIEIEGVSLLQPVEHTILADRLEAGALLIATAATGGHIDLPQAPAHALELFLVKLEEMGHTIEIGAHGIGVRLYATQEPRAVSFRTAPYPGFPTDLQAPMMALQCAAQGKSVVQETVFENRLLHVRELQKMGAQISIEHNTATITGVDELYGTSVIATDIRASCALVVAGLMAKGTTIMTGIHHWKRGYEALEEKLARLGANIILKEVEEENPHAYAVGDDIEKQARV